MCKNYVIELCRAICNMHNKTDNNNKASNETFWWNSKLHLSISRTKMPSTTKVYLVVVTFFVFSLSLALPSSYIPFLSKAIDLPCLPYLQHIKILGKQVNSQSKRAHIDSVFVVNCSFLWYSLALGECVCVHWNLCDIWKYISVSWTPFDWVTLTQLLTHYSLHCVYSRTFVSFK